MRRIQIISFGKVKDEHLKALIEYYQRLIGKYWDIELKSLRDPGERKPSPKDLPADLGYKFVLSERGDEYTTIKFASELRHLTEQHELVSFIIGNAYGVADELLASADQVLSLSKLTLPHKLCQVVLLEQLYRALNLNAGGKYHK